MAAAFLVILFLASMFASRMKRTSANTKVKAKRMTDQELGIPELSQEQQDAFLLKELLKKQRQLEREAKAYIKDAKAAEKQRVAEYLAGSNLEFYDHRMGQILDMIENLELKQEGTLYGGKEWTKIQKQIMSYENQYQTLRIKKYKAEAVCSIA